MRRARDWDRDRDRDDRRWRNNGYRVYVPNRGYGAYGNYGNYGGYGGGYQSAERQGYQDGLNTGASDAARGQSYDPERSHFYRNANYGYNSAYGNRGGYQQAYRNGFLRGYQQGYQRYGGNNRVWRR